jgi:shikimate kinase
MIYCPTYLVSTAEGGGREALEKGERERVGERRVSSRNVCLSSGGGWVGMEDERALIRWLAVYVYTEYHR